MKWFVIFLLVFMILIILPLQGQNVNEVLPKGARSIAMGATGINQNDAWSIFNNVGALARVDQTQAIFGYDHRFRLEELTTIHAGILIPHSKFAFGLGVSSFGGDDYNQRNLGLGIAHQLGIASVGLKINYLQTNIEGFGRSAVPVLEFGGVAELGPHLLFGAKIYNPIQSSFGKDTETNLPTLISAGLTFLVNEKVILNAEVEKDILEQPLLKLGIDYQLFKVLSLRMGNHPQRRSIFYGLGLNAQRFTIHLASGENLNLGRTLHFSLSYKFP
jgi:hypothetical protein